MNTDMPINIIPKIFNQLINENNDTQFKFIIVFILCAAIIAYLHASIQTNIISGTSILIIVCSIGVTYYYVKKSYRKKLKLTRNRTILDSICKNIKSHRICPQYINSKKNLATIEELLIKQI